MATEEAVEVGADLVALFRLQVVTLCASGLEEVGALLAVACDRKESADMLGIAEAHPW